MLLWNIKNQNPQKVWRKKAKGKDLPRVIRHPTNSCQSWQETAASEHGWMWEFIFVWSLFGPCFRICQEGWQLVSIMTGFSVIWIPIQEILDLYYQTTLHLYLKILCMTLQPSVTTTISHVDIETIFLHHKKATLCSLQLEVLLSFLRRYQETTTRKAK